jgi:hypothetical protein
LRAPATNKTLPSLPLEAAVLFCWVKVRTWASFFLTKFEWETAERSNNYQFHLWSLVGNEAQLAVLTEEDITPHIPIKQNQGVWEDVSISFGICKNSFSVINF